MELTLSLLVPCYNVGPYIQKFLENISAQKIPFDEVIFYNDASEDNTAEILRNSGATVIEGSQNMGAAFARNRLLEHSRSHWVHFHDADDLLNPDFVKICKETIIKYRIDPRDRTCLLSNMVVEERESGKHIQITKYNQSEIDRDPVRYFLTHTGYAIIGCYPRQLLQSIHGFSEKLRGNEDPDLHIRLAINNSKFKCLNMALVTNLIRQDSFSAKNHTKCLKDRLTCYTEYLKELPNYKNEIGKELFLIGSWFFNNGHFIEGSGVLQIIKQYKIKYLAYTTRFGHFYSKLLGIEAYFLHLKLRNRIISNAKATK